MKSELDAAGESAVYEEVGARDEAGGRAGEERHAAGYLLRAGHPPGRVESERGGEWIDDPAAFCAALAGFLG